MKESNTQVSYRIPQPKACNRVWCSDSLACATFSVRHTLRRTSSCSCSSLNIMTWSILSFPGPLYCGRDLDALNFPALMEAASSRQELLYMSCHQESPLFPLEAEDHTRGVLANPSMIMTRSSRTPQISCPWTVSQRAD